LVLRKDEKRKNKSLRAPSEASGEKKKSKLPPNAQSEQTIKLAGGTGMLQKRKPEKEWNDETGTWGGAPGKMAQETKQIANLKNAGKKWSFGQKMADPREKNFKGGKRYL